MAASVSQVLTGLSSMATRQLLADLAADIGDRHGVEVSFESGGGVEVERRVRDGAVADVLVLAVAAMRGLDADGLLLPGTLRPLFVSEVVAAVGSGRSVTLATEDDLRDLLLASTRVAYSTGPSGTAVLALLQRWGLTEPLADRLVQAPAGVPVGSLLADGAADLGFQQYAELKDVAGITVLGPLPGDAAIASTFSGAVLAVSAQPAAAAGLLDLLGSPEVSAVVSASGLSLAL